MSCVMRSYYSAMLLLILIVCSLSAMRRTASLPLSCPHGCSCDPVSSTGTIVADYIRVDCAGRRAVDSEMSSFDFEVGDYSANATVDLDLSRNGFIRLPLGTLWSSTSSSSPFRFDRLRHVDLSSNNVESITSGSLSEFVGAISGPRSLSLADNEIVDLSPGCFVGLGDVERLTLSGNRLTRFDAVSFAGLGRLDRLELDRNQIESLPPSAFSCLRSLSNISLAHNRIVLVDGTTFARSSLTLPDRDTSQTTVKPSPPPSNSARYLLVDVRRRNGTSPSRCGDDEMVTVGEGIKYVDLSYNLLRTTPDWGSAAETLVGVALDGNPIRRLGRWSFRSMPRLVAISLTSMPELITVDSRAFVDVPRLAILRLHGNRRLGFIDPDALDFRSSTAPVLVVSMHDNALQAVPDLATSSSRRNSTLTMTLTVGGNPFHCDCNIRWIRDVVLAAASTTSGNGSRSIADHENVRCDSPTSVRGLPLIDLKPEVVSADQCPPVVIPFFEADVAVAVGGAESTFSLDCRAIGLPRPRLHWILPAGRIVNASSAITVVSSRRDRIDVDPSGSLTVSGFRNADRGTYTCVAMNERGYDAAATTLRPVRSTDPSDQPPTGPSPCGSTSTNDAPRLSVKGVSSTYVAVTWSGSDTPTDGQFGYSIVYREFDPRSAGNGRRSTVESATISYLVDDDDDDDDEPFIAKFRLRPFMRALTINNLHPLTTYEFCIGCEPSPPEQQQQQPPSSSTRPVIATHQLPAPPLSIGRRHQHQQLRRQMLSAAAASMSTSSTSCIRVRTAAVVGDGAAADEYDFRFEDGSDAAESTAAGVIRTVFGVTVMSSVVAVMSLCGLLVCVRRLRARCRRRAYAEPADRGGGGGTRLNVGEGSTGPNRLKDDDCRQCDGMTAAGKRRKWFGGRVTLIPLNNLAELPSTNLSSSRTSLLHAL